eukprot:TRINITY_DN737_c7_g1_i5.p1 TRINITY_DN737_c7_g1~~TRINITY_DN737_c7_g1_i5.p1  ORF type:complete len:228 (-),score=93.72 TRINITY_DN737_c7_g1_i5:16-699(-)
MLIEVFQNLATNPYFSAGAGLFGIGSGVALLRTSYRYSQIAFKRNFIVTLEIPSKDKSFSWILQWITNRAKNSTQHLSAETSFEQLENGKIITKFDFVPSPGIHFLKFKGNWIRVERVREKNMIDIERAAPFETLTLTMLGRNKKLFEQIMEDARQIAISSEEGKTVIYTSIGPEWRRFGNPRKRRPISSVILDMGLAERIIDDIKEFLYNSQWYTSRGLLIHLIYL